MPLAFSPVFYLAKHFASDPATFALTACHFISMLLTTALVWGVYRIFRINLNRVYSLLGAALLLFNPLIVHAAPISKEDIPGALFTTWTFYFYLRYWKDGRLKYGLLTGLFVIITMGTRYNVIPLLPVVMAAHELLNARQKIRLADFLRKAGLLTVAPTVVWLIIPSMIFFSLGLAGFFEAPGQFLAALLQASVGATGSDQGYPEYPWENVVFLVRSYSIPIFALSIWGMVACWRRKLPGGIFHGLWLGVFLAFHSFALGHKEARYLFCFFPSLYFFAVQGFIQLTALAKGRAQKTLAVMVVLAWPTYLASTECIKFFDPFYRHNFAREVSLYAASIAGEKQIRWFGPFYAIHPKEFMFDPEDEVTYLYHVYIHTVRYYTGKTMFAFPHNIALSIPGPVKNGIFPPANLGVALADGDAVIINAELGHYVSKTVPVTLKPLIVERAKVMQFELTAAGEFRVLGTGSGHIEMKHTAAGFEFRTSGLAPGSYELFVALSDGTSATAGSFETTKGGQPGTLPENILPTGTSIKAVSLLSFDSLKLFSIPTP